MRIGEHVKAGMSEAKAHFAAVRDFRGFRSASKPDSLTNR